MTALTVNIMTASLSPGDAIGNYVLSLRRILQGWGVRVLLFADNIDPAYPAFASHSEFYQPTGSGILWFHYSIYSDNVALARDSADFTLIDYHGISPPRLFEGQNEPLAELCRRAIALLPHMAHDFDACIVHSRYTFDELVANGYAAERIHQMPLCIDTRHFAAGPDAALAERLQQLTYFLFIGRIVPQKDILALIRIFAAVNRQRPDTVLFLVGSRHLAPGYQRQIDRLIRQEKLNDRIMLTGQINNPALLAALLQQAAFYLVASEWESFCVPVAEAAYFGTPTVTHDVPPLPEVAGPGGLVVDKHDPDAVADVILHHLAQPQMHQELRRQTAAWGQRYTDTALAANVLALLRELFIL